jgi:hypothetical protein
MKTSSVAPDYKGFRFPLEMISHVVCIPSREMLPAGNIERVKCADGDAARRRFPGSSSRLARTDRLLVLLLDNGVPSLMKEESNQHLRTNDASQGEERGRMAGVPSIWDLTVSDPA